MRHLFAHFLTNSAEYSQAQAEWAKLWESIPDRDEYGWRSGWFELQQANDGNPIFTAISDANQKAIRVIQYEPTSNDVEIDCWLDTFGGPVIDPSSIRELVIACALSDESKQIAHELMAAWVVGELELEKGLDSQFGPLRVERVLPQESRMLVSFHTPASQRVKQ